jgi:hypothetical protein
VNGLKEGAVRAVGEKSPQKRSSNLQEGEMSHAETSGRKEQRHINTLFGTNSLKEGAV